MITLQKIQYDGNDFDFERKLAAMENELANEEIKVTSASKDRNRRTFIEQSRKYVGSFIKY